MFASIARIVIDAKDAEKIAEFYRQIFELLNVGESRTAGSPGPPAAATSLSIARPQLPTIGEPRPRWSSASRTLPKQREP
jgi:hypothetical protein